MKQTDRINVQRMRRARRARARAKGTAERPRLSVFRSNTRLYAQLINDAEGKTIVSAYDKKGIAAANALGKKIAEAAMKIGITKALLDRGSYRYHGNVKAIAEGARAGGIQL